MALVFAVDDDPQVRGLLKVLFEDQGHEVLSLESGKYCVDRLDENPSAVFLDMVMPEMASGDLVAALREQHPDIPVCPHQEAQRPLDAVHGGLRRQTAQPNHRPLLLCHPGK